MGSYSRKSKREQGCLTFFGYTGAATVAGAIAGLKVAHVDASKDNTFNSKEKLQLSGLDDDAVTDNM